MSEYKDTHPFIQMLKKSWLLPILLLILGIGSSILWGTYTILQYRSMTPNSPNLLKEQIAIDDQSEITDLTPVHLSSKSFSVAITPITFSKDSWNIPSTNAGHITSSAYPTQVGNAIIYGHNTPEILGGLLTLKKHDMITITLNNGQERIYKVFNTAQVTPDNIQYLWPRRNEMLTIYTTTGFLNKDRFFVQATPIQSDIQYTDSSSTSK